MQFPAKSGWILFTARRVSYQDRL